ncbi:SKS1_2 [Sanghuangporus sanghuang]
MTKRSDVLNDPAYRGCPSHTLPPLKDAIIDGGRLHLKNLLGYGAWSAVYLAECTAMESHYNMDQLYAVKCMIPRRMTPWQQKAISQEVRLHRLCAAASSSILKIVKVIDDEPTGLKYIVTEYCEGGDLNDLIQQRKKENTAKDDERIRRIFLQILDAVMTCHEEGVYHRDLKPENIMLKKKGNKAVLGDFGFATTNMYTRDFGMGSEPYMAPELLTRSSTPISTPHADIWALGIILVNLITGYYPWRKACSEDRVFEWYSCNDRNFLFRNLKGISCETNEILKSIFRFRPRQRISIRELARRISRVKTFTHETDFDIDGGLVPRRELAVDRHLANPAPGVLHNPRVARLKKRSEANEVPHNVLEADFSRDLPGLERGTDSDDSDSDGPVTPETYAIDNAALAHAGDVASLENVSDLNLDEVPVRKPERNRFRIVRVTTKEMIEAEGRRLKRISQFWAKRRERMP